MSSSEELRAEKVAKMKICTLCETCRPSQEKRAGELKPKDEDIGKINVKALGVRSFVS